MRKLRAQERSMRFPYGRRRAVPRPASEDAAHPVALCGAGFRPRRNIDVIARADRRSPARIIAGDGPLRDLLPDALGLRLNPRRWQRALRPVSRRRASSRRWKASPNVVLEAMAHGKDRGSQPPVGGIPTLIEDGRTGFPRSRPAMRTRCARPSSRGACRSRAAQSVSARLPGFGSASTARGIA